MSAGRTVNASIIAMVAAVSFIAGLIVSGAFNDSQQLDVERQQQRVSVKLADISASGARLLENQLSELKANENSEKQRAEVAKPVFSERCASPEYVRLFNSAAERAERTLSGKHADTVPGQTAAPDR